MKDTPKPKAKMFDNYEPPKIEPDYFKEYNYDPVVIFVKGKRIDIEQNESSVLN